MPGSAQPVVLIADFPPTMIPLRRRLEEAGYAFFPTGAAEGGGLSPAVAVVPFTMQTDLAQLDELLTAAIEAHPTVRIIGVNFGRMRFKTGEAYAAGISFLYGLPFEEELLINKIFELAPPELDAKDLTIDQLMRVNVLELERAPSLPFNLYLYLPANRKAIHYYHRDSVIDEKRVRKFKENAHYALYIRRTEVKAYKQYCADVVNAGGAAGDAVQAHDSRQRSAERLMGLMSGFFSDEALGEEEQQMALDNLRGVVETLETPGTPREMIGEVNKIAARQMTHVTHAQNVAAYSCLFGMAIGAGDPTTLKIGGLLHDLGLADFPAHLLHREPEEMTPEDAAMYKLHPGNAKIMIEDRRLKVPPGAMDMILYHHERPDGSGYPYGKTSADIPLIAKVCAFANEFDKLTSVRVNKRQLSPVEAVLRLAGLDGGPPHPMYEEAVHRPLVDLLLKPRATAPEPGAAGPNPGAARTPDPRAGRGVRIESLVREPKFAGARTARITRDAPGFAPLWKDLEDHWARRGVPKT